MFSGEDGPGAPDRVLLLVSLLERKDASYDRMYTYVLFHPSGDESGGRICQGPESVPSAQSGGGSISPCGKTKLIDGD